MTRDDFLPGMRVRTVKPHLVTALTVKHRNKRVVWHGTVSHLSSERVGAVWVTWDADFSPSGAARPVRPEMICRETARALAV